MFRKGPPKAQTSLTERVRQLGTRAPAAENAIRPLPLPASKQRAPRPAVFKNATVTFADGARLAVVIKDLTESGARIEFFVRTTLPDEVLLSEPMLKLRRRARVVWQQSGAAGLHFIA